MLGDAQYRKSLWHHNDMEVLSINSKAAFLPVLTMLLLRQMRMVSVETGACWYQIDRLQLLTRDVGRKPHNCPSCRSSGSLQLRHWSGHWRIKTITAKKENKAEILYKG
ncbi:Hypothetical predicted protein [Podarcis lilfordi]|uniref:Uncharacterized protein n=1 Tax=Podarcis lilfordi TaxID=74358 RepID=A0AA35PGQ8_9SAUR|nr:Hypothetical predicted protein [Podarcis lilfordi]